MIGKGPPGLSRTGRRLWVSLYNETDITPRFRKHAKSNINVGPIGPGRCIFGTFVQGPDERSNRFVQSVYHRRFVPIIWSIQHRSLKSDAFVQVLLKIDTDGEVQNPAYQRDSFNYTTKAETYTFAHYKVDGLKLTDSTGFIISPSHPQYFDSTQPDQQSRKCCPGHQKSEAAATLDAAV